MHILKVKRIKICTGKTTQFAKSLWLRNFAKNLGLPVLLGGYDGLYIRIWAWDFGENMYVIDLVKGPQKNECSIISFVPVIKDSISYILVHERKKVIPISGWNNFFDSLGKYDIITAKSGKYKELKIRFTSMENIQFEVDQPNQYRYYKCLDPYYYKDEDTTSAKIYAFLQYFNQEMKTDIYDISKKR